MTDQQLSIRRARRRLVAIAAALLALMSTAAVQSVGSDSGDSARGSAPQVRLIPVPLPIVGTGDTHVKRLIDQLLSGSESDGERPILILEFRARKDQAGEGSEFERCLSLARFLASDRLSSTRTVAFVPGDLKGHAILPVLACEELIINRDAQFGEAGLDEDHVDRTMRAGYREIAERRRTIPAAVALGMLDKEATVHRVETLDGIRYVLGEELEELKASTTVSTVESLIPPGDMGRFSGSELRLKYGFASHLASDYTGLAKALDVSPSAIEQDPSQGGQWHPIRIDVDGPVNVKSINWVIKSAKQQLSGGDINFVCVWIDSPGGSANDSVRLANFLAELDANKVRTVAFVRHEARADAAIIALACEQLVMTEDAILGGSGAVEISRGDMPDLQRSIQSVARARHRDWSLPVGLVDRELAVHRFTRQETGEVRYFCDDELAEQDSPDSWQRGAEIPVGHGLSGREAVEYELARQVASGFDEFRQLYHLEEELKPVQPNWAHGVVEKLASPRFASILLFVACFTLFIELSQPGISVAGFCSGLCAVLYFWASFLHGTAGWLEVLLFLTGLTFVILEIFVIPGVGIFGFGGGLMVVVSIILASQTFVIPQNAYQVRQLPSSLMVVVAAGTGAFTSLILMRKYLPDAPILKRMLLAPPDEEDEDLTVRESLVDFAPLLGKRGTTTTQLTPSGKARFGDDIVDVISDGEVVSRGTNIYVSSVRGNHVLVVPIPDKS